MKKFLLPVACLLVTGVLAQNNPKKDKGKFVEYAPGFYENSILKGIEAQDEQKKETPKKPKSFKVDLSTVDAPKSAEEFTGFWKNEPISQGNTGTCWSFSTTSYFEAEVYRLTKQQIKLSEMHTAYWEYVEKATRFVKERGNSLFDEGSEANAVTKIYKKYGVVPLEQYTAMLSGQSYHNHSVMVEEMKNYLKSVKENNAWNEAEVVATIKSIMNHYMGEPPKMVLHNGKQFTPQAFLTDVLKLKMDDYVDVTSIMGKPYWTQVEYEVPDNWWHNADYYNVPLEDYMKILKSAIRSGYSLSIGGDVSESGFVSQSNVAVIPTYDIPSEYIDENARWFRFANGTTTDDHGMHLIGYKEKDGKDWYLIKDSGAGSRNCGKDSKNFGYYFFHEDYVKLKMMDFMVHKDAFKDYIGKFKK